MLTLCDSIRVADDMGKLQFQLKIMHMPLFGWKGSYVVSNVSFLMGLVIIQFTIYVFNF